MKWFLPFILIILIFIPIRIRNVNKPLKNITSFRQAQTATVALNFYKNGINFFKSELDILGKGKERFVTLEFPLYQAVVASLYKVFFVHDMWGRAVSIASGFVAALMLFLTVYHLLNNRGIALLSAFFFLSAPLNMFHHQDFLIEPFVIACLMIAFYFYLFWIDSNKNKYIFFSMILFSLSFMHKIMYGPFLFIPLGWYFFKKNQFNPHQFKRFLLSFLIPLLIYIIWQKQADFLNISNNQSYFTSSNIKQLEWNIGSIKDHFSVDIWSLRVINILKGMFLKPGLIIFLFGLIGLIKNKKLKFFYVWLIAETIYYLIFFKIQSHFYYQMVIIPVTSVFIAAGMIRFSTIVKSFSNKYYQYLFISLFSSFYLWRSIISSDWDQSLDLNWHSRLMEVGKSVSGEKYGIIVNPKYDWNSVYTYYPKLKLLSVSIEDLIEKNIRKWKDEGYTYIILHNYKDYPFQAEYMNGYNQILVLEDFKVYLIDS